MADSPIRAGVAGLGMAGAGIVRQLAATPGVELAAATDLREHALGAFREQYGGRAHASFERLCDDPDIDAVWVATPSHLHREHVERLAASGKHVVVEKPMAPRVEDCLRMVEAAERHGVALIAGGARSFDPAFVAMRSVIKSGRLGGLGALTTWSFTSWMTRAREPHELDPDRDGGCILNQAPHPVDVLRLLGGGGVRSVRGSTVDLRLPGRPGPGYFTALLEFDDGTPASFVYDGYGYIQGWELVPWGETPPRLRAAQAANAYRRELRSGEADEYAARERLRFAGGQDGFGGGEGGWTPLDAGVVIATCERGELRQSRTGLYVYDDEGRHDEPLPAGASGRQNEVAELGRAMKGEAVLHSGRWGAATIEVVQAISESARERREAVLRHQVPAI